MVDLNEGVEVIGNVIHFSEVDRRVRNNAVRFAERLVKAGWKVNRHALGQPWTHEMARRSVYRANAPGIPFQPSQLICMAGGIQTDRAPDRYQLVGVGV